MKKNKLLLVVLAALGGIGFGVSENVKGKVAGQIYYGVKGADGKGRWLKIRPTPLRYVCLSSFNGLACEITSTTPEATVLSLVNQYPAQYTILNNSQNKIYQQVTR